MWSSGCSEDQPKCPRRSWDPDQSVDTENYQPTKMFYFYLFKLYFVANFVSLRQISLGCIQGSHKRSVRERGCLKIVSGKIPPQLKLLLRFRKKAKVLIPYCPMRNPKWWHLFQLAHFYFPTLFSLEERVCKHPKDPCSRDNLQSPGPRYYWSEGEDGCRNHESS